MKIHASPAGPECITLVYIACRAFERPREDAISVCMVCADNYVHMYVQIIMYACVCAEVKFDQQHKIIVHFCCYGVCGLLVYTISLTYRN